jgi:hypothetical protein
MGSYLVAAALFLTASLNRLLVLVFPLWVVILCALIWLAADDAPIVECAP